MLKQTILLPEVIIDSHCHGRDMEESHKTTVKQTLLEARNGNISISVLMPNTNPPIDWIYRLRHYITIKKQAEKFLKLRQQYLYFGITDFNFEECDQALRFPEVVGLKNYPKGEDIESVTTGKIGVMYDSTILLGMKLCRDADKVFAAHCDDPKIIAIEGNTIKAEVEYVKKIIESAKLMPGVKIVICHVSCRQSAELILQAQTEGTRIAMELVAHYLWFNKDGTNWNPNIDPIFYHCFNNLRGKEHRIFLVNLLTLNNPLIFIGSDTACHTKYEKLAKQLGGIPSNQEMVAVIVTLASQLGLSDEQVARLLSWNAGEFLNIPVSRNLVEYKLEKRIDALQYNNGIVVNPWNGSKLLFPVKI